VIEIGLLPLKTLGLALCAFFLMGKAQAQHSPLPTIDLYVGMHRVQTELAVKPNERAQGLMGRPSLPEMRGMLFVFDRPGVQCFWMRNTLIPLSIAFLRDDGSIVNIEDMQPLKDDSHCSAEPVRLALEVNQGWFAKRNISPGMSVRGLPTLK
jgi:uncharacterized membrane protein (UPF0127 family)